MIKGSVPGSRGGDLIVRPAVKPRKAKVVVAPKAGKGGK
jgi:ribosomal protein L3